MDGPENTNGEQTFVRVTNAMVWAKLLEIEDMLDTLKDYPSVKKQVRRLEFKFYAILAGLIGAVTSLFVLLVGKI